MNILQEGRSKIIEMDIGAIRVRQKKQLKRAEEYMRSVYDGICNLSINIDEKISRVVTQHNGDIATYRCHYRRLVRHAKD